VSREQLLLGQGVLTIARHRSSVGLLDRIQINVWSLLILALLTSNRGIFLSVVMLSTTFLFALQLLLHICTFCMQTAVVLFSSLLFSLCLSSEVLLLKAQLDLSHEKFITVRSPLQKLFERVLQKS